MDYSFLDESARLKLDFVKRKALSRLKARLGRKRSLALRTFSGKNESEGQCDQFVRDMVKAEVIRIMQTASSCLVICWTLH